MHLVTLAPAHKSALSASSANRRGSNGPRANTEEPRARSTRRPGGKRCCRTPARSVGSGAAASEESGRPAPQSPAPALPQPRPRHGEKFPAKVRGTRSRSQPPNTTASRRESGPRWPGRGPGTLGRASLSPHRPPRFTYHRAGRRAATGRAAAAAAVASGAAAGARPRGEKRRKVVLCRLRDTAEPAPGSAPSPTLPPASSLSGPPAPRAPAPQAVGGGGGRSDARVPNSQFLSRHRRLTLCRTLAAASTPPSPTPLQRLRREPPAAAAGTTTATPLPPPAPARLELLGTRNAPPRPHGRGRGSRPSERRDSPAQLALTSDPGVKARLLPPRPPTHAPPLSKKPKISFLLFDNGVSPKAGL